MRQTGPLATQAKGLLPEAQIVIVGYHATIEPELTLREDPDGINKRYERSQVSAVQVLEKHLIMSGSDAQIKETINNSLLQRFYEFGYVYLREGDVILARQMFNKSLTIRFRLKVYLMKIFTFIQFKAVDISNKLLKSIFNHLKLKSQENILKNYYQDESAK